jgi:hypothetical protein
VNFYIARIIIMLIQNSIELKKFLCTCSKCRNKDTEKRIGMLIPKSTRTRHRKKEHENPPLDYYLSSGSSSELVSSLSLSDVDSSSAESEMVESSSNNFIYHNDILNNISNLENIDVDMANSDTTSDSNIEDMMDFNMEDNRTSDYNVEDDWNNSNIDDDWTSDEDDWISDFLIDESSDSSRDMSGKKPYQIRIIQNKKILILMILYFRL